MIDWNLYEKLVSQDIKRREDPVIELLVSHSTLPLDQQAAVLLHNGNQEVLQSSEDWLQMLKILEANAPISNNWNKSRDLNIAKAVASQNLRHTPFALDIMEQLLDEGSFSKNYTRSVIKDLFSQFLTDTSSLTVDQAAQCKKILFKNLYQTHHWLPAVVSLLPEAEQPFFIYSCIRDVPIKNDVSSVRFFLHHAIGEYSFENINEWNRVWENKEDLEFYYLYAIANKDFFNEALLRLIEKMNYEQVTKDNAEQVYSLISMCIPALHSVHPKIYKMAEDVRPFCNIKKTNQILRAMALNQKDDATFEPYIKNLIKNEERIGVLIELSKYLNKKQLPWLLSTNSKPLKKAVKKRMETAN